ncbi:metallophosphoesterase [Pontibacter sp. MBLB2868]|uniref:metallophosphoesterase n=1 Tax=Pontibacter sp. MBLB2868 TaxID=3451555 RepID=UPI003F754E0C
MKRFATSDCHGGYRALVQCMERCGFDKENDQLIFIGDVVDGWPETKECIELLLSVKNLTYLLGNHDQWALEYYSGNMSGDEASLDLWLSQGGAATIQSYGVQNPMPKEHLLLLQQAQLFYETDDKILFVHAGFQSSKPLEENDAYTLLWSREFITEMYGQYMQKKLPEIKEFKAVYLGHTPTISFNKTLTKPLEMGNVILLDTGAAFTGSLSITDIDSKEVWQSDRVMTLYPDHEGRNGMSWEMMKNNLLLP